MPWTERQRAMLAEMGLRVWGPPADAATASAEATALIAERSAAPVARAAAPDAPVAAVATPAAPRVAMPAQAPLPVQAMMPSPVLADPDGIASLDADALRAAVVACTACGLAAGRRRVVFGSAPLSRSDWMIVGEAPGEAEDADGEPHAGDAGRLLDNMLRALGLVRAAPGVDPARSACLAHVVRCRPPRDRQPAPDELARCAPWLQRQIALVRPRILLAMGRQAAESLLGTTEPIGRLRGRVHEVAGVPLVVTYAPGYLLRHLEEKARTWDDLCLARETLLALPATATSSP